MGGEFGGRMDTCICMAECLCCPSETITTLYSHACTPIQNKNQSEKKLSLSSGKGWGKRWEEGIVREFGKVMYTLLYLKWITNKDLLYSTWNSAQCYVAAWMGGEFRAEWIHVYVWLSPSAVYPTLSQHCTVMAILWYKIKRLKMNLVCH